ncbi:hypothetical protein BDB00DRAFT_872775 [Zychaea mexicana]|uniref:uncharacterized protein n=1 Tax=Zychaea mexicana TaxID=64656 RepID=UPI0022FE7D01|nr:uncharacterized protein BDB00DRAFT_872775 [Zychaea mexicana]KAI9493058.1 hypothetical protein BDB00DRAFT_872775 [Zychaea mexicana]
MATENMEQIVDMLRNNIEFASVAQFFHTFQSAFHPWPAAYNPASFLAHQSNINARVSKRSDDGYVFATEDLEAMLLKSEEGYRLQELVIRMLRLLTRNRFINNDTWQTYFSKEINRRGGIEPNPFLPEKQEDDEQQTADEQAKEDESSNDEKPLPTPKRALKNFFEMPLSTKVHLLYILCEWQLDDAHSFREHLDSEEDAVHWRVEPIGYDAKGSSFWLFDDNRLYKETPEPKRKKSQKKNARKPRPRPKGTRRSSRHSSAKADEAEEEEEEIENWVPWKLVCLTKHDWNKFPQKYENSNNLDEQRFYDLLVNDVLPKVVPVMREHEDELKKKEALANRKRSSRIMYKELAALEQEQQVAKVLQGEASRKSSRREEMARKREEELKVKEAKAREDRVKDRERRLEQREHAQEEAERRKALAESKAAAKKAPGGKKRGRKPKNKKVEEEDAWSFDCVCGVSGHNIDDGSPMIACERCGTWQHIECLQKARQIPEDEEALNKAVFFCRPCQEKESQEVNVDGFEDDGAPQNVELKRTKIEHVPTSSVPVSSRPPATTNFNGHILPLQAAPSPAMQPWTQRPPPPPTATAASTNSERRPSPVFPILKPMLPSNFANGNGRPPVLPPLLPQVSHSMYPQSIRPAPPPQVHQPQPPSQPRPLPQIQPHPQNQHQYPQSQHSHQQHSQPQQSQHPSAQQQQRQYTHLPSPQQQQQQPQPQPQPQTGANGYHGANPHHHQVGN